MDASRDIQGSETYPAHDCNDWRHASYDITNRYEMKKCAVCGEILGFKWMSRKDSGELPTSNFVDEHKYKSMQLIKSNISDLLSRRNFTREQLLAVWEYIDKLTEDTDGCTS